jgi:energy-coupling factor transport system ATP-binding protein
LSTIIAIENLSYAYPVVEPNAEPVWVLDGINLKVNAGEFVAIMGPTGGGKTTLCLALNGIVPHSTGGVIGGNVLIGGRDSKQQSVAELARTVGLIFQKPETQLFNMTVEAEVAFGLETLGLPPAEMHERIDWALSLVGMTGFRPRSPFELSEGQKQRVAIAAILAMKPPVLVLDEPTASLDPLGKREVFAAVDMLRQQEGITIIMVSHEAEQIAAFAQRVVVLSGGKVVLDGTPKSVFMPTRQLSEIGLSVPQVSRLADCLNQRLGSEFAFTQLHGAYEGLREAELAASPLVNGPPTHSTQTESAAANQFTIQNLSYSYSNEHDALDNISLTIRKGEFVAVLGQNGAGKTTLVKHFNGLLRPTQGQILLDQVDIADNSVAELAQTVGYVFQNPDHMIFSPTVREELAAGPRNLGLAEPAVAQRVEETLDQFGLIPYADLQPALLSFGLRRKVSVAAVVAMQTAVLILDEPTTGLDRRSIDDLMAILVRLNRQGRTIILITHDMGLVARYVPWTILLHRGQLLAHDCTRPIFQQADLLHKTQLESPQITQLGRQLGMRNEILRVSELCERVNLYD